MRPFFRGSCAVAIVLALCGSAQRLRAQAPGTGTDSYTVLFRRQSTLGDFVAFSIDRPASARRIQDLVCEIARDDRIHIGASATLELRMYRDIPASEYIPEENLRFLNDEDAVAAFGRQEEQVLAVYNWSASDGVFIRTLAQSGRLKPTGIELLMDEQGNAFESANSHEFDHTVACAEP